MAELHILGQLHGVSDFNEQSSLFCRYSVQVGPNWTLISGSSEGQTVAGQPDFRTNVIWAHPLDLHFFAKGIQGWPKLVLQVSCLDSLGRSWIVGYGACSLPPSPGHHRIEVPCWVPAAVNITDKIRQYFLGGTHQLTQTDIINLGTDSHKWARSPSDVKLPLEPIDTCIQPKIELVSCEVSHKCLATPALFALFAQCISAN